MSSDFESKTWAELKRLTAECAKVRRQMPTQHHCGGCRYCFELHTFHSRIDDHLDQLEGKVPDEDTAISAPLNGEWEVLHADGAEQ